MDWKLELFLVFYFVIGLLVNVWYYESHKTEFIRLTANQLALNFIFTWVIWLPLYLWYLFRYFVWKVVHW